MYFLLLIFLVLLSFSFVVFFGAPYLPVMSKSAGQAIEMLDLNKDQTIIDLGSGGGKFLRLAAKNNLIAIGYELNPLLFLFSKITSLRRTSRIRVVYGNFWNKQLPECDAIYVFLLPKYMKKLDKKISSMKLDKDLKLISYSFQIPGKVPRRSKNNLFLYVYPKNN